MSNFDKGIDGALELLDSLDQHDSRTLKQVLESVGVTNKIGAVIVLAIASQHALAISDAAMKAITNALTLGISLGQKSRPDAPRAIDPAD